MSRITGMLEAEGASLRVHLRRDIDQSMRWLNALRCDPQADDEDRAAADRLDVALRGLREAVDGVP